MAAHDPTQRSTSGAVAALERWRDPDDPALAQARRALALARVEARIRQAIEAAPPLDADTLARIRALIPPAPAESGDRDG